MAPLHRVWLIVALLIAAALPARRCSAQPLPERRTLTGHLSTAAGAAIPNQAFQIVRTNKNQVAQMWSATVTTDARGDFSVPGMEDGPYYILLGGVRIDARHLMGGYDEGGQQYTVDAEHAHWNVELRLPPALIVHLVAPDGQPAAGAHGQYVLIHDQSPRRGSFIADAGGSFQALDVAAGDYTGLIAYTLDGGYATGGAFALAEDALPTEITLPLKRGGTLRIQAVSPATPMKAQTGDVASLSPLTPVRHPGGISVHLRSLDPNPSELLQMQLRTLPDSYNVTADGTGACEYKDLPPGGYTVSVGQDDPSASPVQRTVTVKAGTVTEEFFSLPFVAAPSLTVTLLDSRGQPIRNQPVQLNVQGSGQSTGPRYASSDAAGHFDLYPVQPGAYRLSVIPMIDDEAAATTGVGTQEVTVTDTDAAVTVALSTRAGGGRGGAGFAGRGQRGGQGFGVAPAGGRGDGLDGFAMGPGGGGPEPAPATAVVPNAATGWTVGVVK